MGRPETTLPRCFEIHSFLLGLGVKPGVKVPRTKWDALLVQGYQIGMVQASNLTRTGKACGLWTVSPGARSIPGSVTLNPEPQVTPTLDEEPRQEQRGAVAEVHPQWVRAQASPEAAGSPPAPVPA